MVDVVDMRRLDVRVDAVATEKLRSEMREARSDSSLTGPASA